MAAMLLTPIAVLGVLWLAGLGAADVFAPRAAGDAKAAIAPLCTVALLVITSPILLLGVTPVALAVSVLAPLVLLTTLRVRRTPTLIRNVTWPLALAMLAMSLSAFPALKERTWAAATYGNQDPYVWVSQARSLTDGPPGGAPAVTPDRIEYNLISAKNWPTGLPATLAELASVERVDPVDAYGVFAAVVAVLFALAVFFCAREGLQLSRRRSVAAGSMVSINGFVLLASFYGWQAQLYLTALAVVPVVALPRALECGSGRREIVLPAAFSAASVGLYGWFALPFVGLAFVAVGLRLVGGKGTVIQRRERVVRLFGACALWFVLGAVAMIRGADVLLRTRARESPLALHFHDLYAWAFPSDALGLVPRGPRDTPGTSWAVVAMSVATAVLVVASARIWRARDPRRLSLLACCAALVATLVAFGVTRSSPYLSVKLMGYAVPFFALLVSGVRWFPSGSGAPAPRQGLLAVFGRVLARVGLVTVLVAALALFVATTLATGWAGWSRMRYATSTDAAATAAHRLPRGGVISLDVRDGWNQVWLVYRLRDRPLVLQRPSIAFTGYWTADVNQVRPPRVKARFALEQDHGGSAIWRGNGLAIYALPRAAASRSTASARD